ncbi:MAG: flagellar biosynthesis anti-sigma factor FlgM [Myxococcota bacterium]|nr:flagellar biosynthesis anti-sigma factor FlgM [Myxococcota bacterium]|tara:strand:- start:158 stop:472 length:315 start_codon:yes stop_codon:yes gene_type:complete
MSIDSLKGAGIVGRVLPTSEPKEVVKSAPQAESAATVDLQAKKYEPVIEASRAKLNQADEARLSALKKAVANGTYPINPEQMAREMLEDRAFYEGLQVRPDSEE